MRNWRSMGVLLTAVFAWRGLMAVAEDAKDEKPVQWWKLDGPGLVPRDRTVVWKSAEQAQKEFVRGEESNERLAAILKAVPFDTHMLVLVSVSAVGEAEFDVERVSMRDGVLHIDAVQDVRPAKIETHTSEVLFLLVPKSDAKVEVAWTGGTMKALRERRDCAGGHADKDMEGGGCERCRKKSTSSPKSRLCGDCARETQSCAFCLKRVPGEPPLKK